jgi:hypothetical protein
MVVLSELDPHLPYKLSRDIIYYSSRELLLPMFGKFNSDNFIKDICLYLEHMIYLPNTFIVNKVIFLLLLYRAIGRAWRRDVLHSRRQCECSRSR